MRNRLAKMIFPFVAVLLLAPWPIAYAYDNSPSGQEAVKIRVAEAEVAPGGTVFGRARGTVKPGDLFFIDATTRATDFIITLNLTNAGEVARYLSYLTLRVGVYAELDGTWQRASEVDGEVIQDNYLTLQDTQSIFALARSGSYKIKINGGNFYCPTSVDKNLVSPKFHLKVD